MTVPARLALFALAVLVAFAAAYGVGAAIGPDLSDVQPAVPAGSHEGMDDHGG